MNRTKSFAMVAIILMAGVLLVLFNGGCSKNEELNTSLDLRSEVNNAVTVKNGMLCFANSKAVETTLKELNGLNDEQLNEWEKAMGFASLRRLKFEAEEAIDAHLTSYLNGGMSRNELMQQVKSESINFIPMTAQKIISRISLVVLKDDTGLPYLDYAFEVPYYLNFLNADYRVMIGDTLYQYEENRYLMFPSPKDLNELSPENAIVAESISPSGTPMKHLPHDHFFEFRFGECTKGKFRIRARFRAQRFIYMNTSAGCTSDCVWSNTIFYLTYTTWENTFWGWRERTYQLDIKGQFDFRSNYMGAVSPTTTHKVNIVSSGARPYYFIQRWDKNSDYPWFEIGNIDCFYVNLTENEDVGINFTTTNPEPTNCNYPGYAGMYRFLNSF